MRLSQLVASATLLALVTVLNTATYAQRTVDTRAALSAVMDAQIFPYGVRQGFKVLGDTKGKKCNFSLGLSLNGTNLYGSPYGQPISASLPWTSPDLKLPTSSGGTYALVVQAIDPSGPGGANACKGQATLSFAVVPETGKLTALSSSGAVMAVNQVIHFKVSGKTFGSCKFNAGLVGTPGGYTVIDTAINPLPYEFAFSFTEPGEVVATADEIDDAPGMPEGCTGHVKASVSVVARPACPAANEYYQSSDDSEFGCLYYSRSNNTLAIFTCPTGYDKFHASSGESFQYGCRKQTSPALALGVISGLLGPSVSPALATLGGSNGPQPDKPTITGVFAVPEGAGSAARPVSNMFYAGEDLQVNVTGNLPNSAGYGNLCGYTVELENIASGKIVESTKRNYSSFGIQEAGPIASSGEYRVHVIPFKQPNLGPPACLGKADSKVAFYPKAAWVTGLTLVGFGYHFNGGDDAGIPQWCENCASIFSPAHNTAFLQIIPTAIGSTPGGTCVYNIAEVGGGENRFAGALIRNGQPAVPSDQQSVYSKTSKPPFWNQWGGVSNTVTVTITTEANDGLYPGCNILGGKITKTITFTDKTGATVTK